MWLTAPFHVSLTMISTGRISVTQPDTCPVLATLARMSPWKYRSVTCPKRSEAAAPVASSARRPTRNTRIGRIAGQAQEQGPVVLGVEDRRLEALMDP